MKLDPISGIKHFAVVLALGTIAFILYRVYTAYAKGNGANAGVM